VKRSLKNFDFTWCLYLKATSFNISSKKNAMKSILDFWKRPATFRVFLPHRAILMVKSNQAGQVKLQPSWKLDL